MLFGQKNIARYISAQQQNYILRNDANMYIQLIRNKPQGNAITGRLVVDGRWFCNTLERDGVEIPALCYHVCVTQSPKFKRLLPLVTGVPRTPQSGYRTASPIGRANGAIGYRQGIRFHVGSKPEHSTGCILVPDREIEELFTATLLESQNNHEEIILEVTDFRPGTEYGYNTQCPSSECAYEKEIRSANFARRHSSSILVLTKHSDDF